MFMPREFLALKLMQNWNLWSNNWGKWYWKTMLELNFTRFITNFSKVKQIMEMKSSSLVNGTTPRPAKYGKNARWQFSRNIKMNLIKIKLRWSAPENFGRISFLFTHDLFKHLHVLKKKQGKISRSSYTIFWHQVFHSSLLYLHDAASTKPSYFSC